MSTCDVFLPPRAVVTTERDLFSSLIITLSLEAVLGATENELWQRVVSQLRVQTTTQLTVTREYD